MKTYYYELDSDNRILWISEENQREDSPTIELESIEDINVWWDKLIDGKIVKANLESENEFDKEGLKAELVYIQQWFKENDWKPNKIITGEWVSDDVRWKSYLLERQVKRTRQDEINELLGE
jgi:hypothetical protein